VSPDGSAIDGFVAAGYESVAEAFAATFRGSYASRDTGGALAIRVDGLSVLDVWGGTADVRTGRPWAHDTATVIFSATKGLLAILAAKLVQERRLDYDAPVAEYWPEFGAAGKRHILVRELLTHRAGLPTTRENLSLDEALDWNSVTSALARQKPFWAPGTSHLYHALTYGWLVGEVIRRVTNMTVGEYFQEAIALPLHAQAWIGVPETERNRVAYLTGEFDLDPVVGTELAEWPERGITLGSAFPPDLISRTGGFNDPRVQVAEVPGAGGIATARALAAIWSATVQRTNGVRLLEDATIADATRVQSEGNPFIPSPPPYLRWGTGFMLDSPPGRRFLGSSSFGHDGAGGQVAFADQEYGVGFAYLSNFMPTTMVDRGNEIVGALRAKLESTRVSPSVREAAYSTPGRL
jgi:CubicO group peptidase (beta-lactamase class C family)